MKTTIYILKRESKENVQFAVKRIIKMALLNNGEQKKLGTANLGNIEIICMSIEAIYHKF